MIPKSKRGLTRLVKQMTLDEKIGQLVTYSAGAPTGPGTGRSDYKEMIAKGQLGSLFNLTGVAETNAMQKIARGEIAPAYSSDLWARHHSRLSHGVSGTAGAVGHVGPGAGGARRARRGERSQSCRRALDLLADG